MLTFWCLRDGAGGIEDGITLGGLARTGLESKAKRSLAEDGHGVGLLDVLLDLDGCFMCVSILLSEIIYPGTRIPWPQGGINLLVPSYS